MSDPKILVVFATVDGQSRKIANHLARTLADAGFRALTAELGPFSAPAVDPDVDGIIVCGPVRFGRHPRRLRRFVKTNREALARLPSAFVSVSGSAMTDDPEYAAEARRYVERFVEKTGWRAERVLRIGGCVAYTRYNPLLRSVMRSISEEKGLSTDTSRDHEYTDWVVLEAFARAFGEGVRGEASEPTATAARSVPAS